MYVFVSIVHCVCVLLPNRYVLRINIITKNNQTFQGIVNLVTSGFYVIIVYLGTKKHDLVI